MSHRLPVALTTTERCVLYLYRLVSDHTRTLIGALLWRAWTSPGEAAAAGYPRPWRPTVSLEALRLDHVGVDALHALKNDLALDAIEAVALSPEERSILRAFRTIEPHGRPIVAKALVDICHQIRGKVAEERVILRAEEAGHVATTVRPFRLKVSTARERAAAATSQPKGAA